MLSCRASSVLLHGLDHFEHAVHFEGHCAIASLTHRLLRYDARIDVCFQVCYLLLHGNRVLHNLLLGLFRGDAHLEDLIDDLLQILNHIVVLRLKVLIRLVDNAHEHLTIVLQCTSKCLQIVVNL